MTFFYIVSILPEKNFLNYKFEVTRITTYISHLV